VNTGARRRDPPWWDHQRHPLIALRRAVEDLLEARTFAGRADRVFDIGAGERPYEPLIRARGFDYVACDLDGSPDIRIEPGRPIPAIDGSAAGVVSFQVLEHVWDLDWYLGECHRLLTRGGWLLLSTHGVWPYHPHPTDFRRWTREGLRGELEARGFDVLELRPLIGPLAWTTQIRLLGFRHVLLAIPLARAAVPLISLVMNLRMVVEDALTPHGIRNDNASVYVAFCTRREEASLSST
jgi:SAM-dependent methyltransferase